MKKIWMLVFLCAFLDAKTQSDVALTWGHNSFNDDQVLFGSAAFYGIRGGQIIDDTYGAQVGYEQTRAANCQGLTLRRYYVNGVVQKKLKGGLTPYALATLGYETSSEEYRPNQFFTGLGAGVKYRFHKNADVFLETRALKSMDSKDVTWATTLGLGYIFDTGDLFTDEEVKKKVKRPVTKRSAKKRAVKYVQRVKPRRKPVVYQPAPQNNVFYDEVLPKKGNYYIQTAAVSHTRLKKPHQQHARKASSGYFVQITALTSSSAAPYIRRVKAKGFSNVGVKRVHGRKIVLVGPYHDRGTAEHALSRLKSVRHDAFIKRY